MDYKTFVALNKRNWKYIIEAEKQGHPCMNLVRLSNINFDRDLLCITYQRGGFKVGFWEQARITEVVTAVNEHQLYVTNTSLLKRWKGFATKS